MLVLKKQVLLLSSRLSVFTLVTFSILQELRCWAVPAAA